MKHNSHNDMIIYLENPIIHSKIHKNHLKIHSIPSYMSSNVATE